VTGDELAEHCKLADSDLVATAEITVLSIRERMKVRALWNITKQARPRWKSVTNSDSALKSPAHGLR